MEILVDEKGKFEYYSYRNEKELEEFVYKTSEEIFGKNTYYIELKKSLGKGRLSYPDGYVIDLSDTENPALYIVEAELEKHDVYRHIYPQITMHLNFFKKNKMKVKNDLEKAIKKNVSCKASIEKRIHNMRARAKF